MAMNRAELRKAIKLNRRDVGGVFHEDGEYNDAINEALRKVPMGLWMLDEDTSLTTVCETRRYSLAGITAVSEVAQVKRVWMEGSDEHYYPLGRYEIEDDLGVLTLVLDEDPPEADRTIKIEYSRSYAALSDDGTDTAMDEDWVVARATVVLLKAADTRLELAAQVAEDLARFDGVRQRREAELRRQVRRKAGRVRSQVW